MNVFSSIALLLASILLVSASMAQPSSEPNYMSGARNMGSASVESLIAERITESFPLEQLVSIKPIANGALYQAELATGLRLYSLPSGEYIMAGILYQASDRGAINLTEQLREQRRAVELSALQANEYLSLAAVDKTIKAAVYIFVDIDCYYCQFQHAETAALNAAGVEVRYLSLNRQKPGSSAYHKVRRTWCSDEPQAALDMLMQGRSLAEKQCVEGLMDKHAQLANRLGVKRLPAVVTADGRLISGLLRSPQILSLLGIEVPELQEELVTAASVSAPTAEAP